MVVVVVVVRPPPRDACDDSTDVGGRVKPRGDVLLLSFWWLVQMSRELAFQSVP